VACVGIVSSYDGSPEEPRAWVAEAVIPPERKRRADSGDTSRGGASVPAARMDPAGARRARCGRFDQLRGHMWSLDRPAPRPRKRRYGLVLGWRFPGRLGTGAFGVGLQAVGRGARFGRKKEIGAGEIGPARRRTHAFCWGDDYG
jgi:hypothetical protein